MSNQRKSKSLSKVVRKILSVIFTLVLIACIAFVAYSAVFSNGNGLLIGPYQAFAVLTGSMEPTIKTGSLAVAKTVPENELDVNDIITFRPIEGKNVLVTHRITDIVGDGGEYTTRGDNNNTEDRDTVPYKSVVGKIVLSVPLIGYLFIALKTPPGIVALAAIVILYEIIRYYFRKERGGYTDEKAN